MKTVVVIPAYNEAATIAAVVQDVADYGAPLVVDDGSSDGTGDRAAAAGAQVVRHSLNRGYDAAIESGFAKAAALGAEIVVTFDADGQHDGQLLDSAIQPIRDDTADVVIGTRSSPARPSEWLFNLYTRLRFGVPDILCGLKAYRMSLYTRHGCFDSHRSIGTELVLTSLKQGARVALVPIPIQPRKGDTRIGSPLVGNGKILGALIRTLWRDMTSSTIGAGSHRWAASGD